ncbi:PDR/VanB family oxidoreductase [Mycobacterium sp. LTG2003]
MDEPSGYPAERHRLGRRLSALVKPYAGEPPPGLYKPATPDLLIRLAGTAIPHFLSVVMRLGGDRELPQLPESVNRRPVRVVSRKIVAHDPVTVELIFGSPNGGVLGRWHAGAHIDLHLPSGRTRQYSLCGDPSRRDEYRIAVRRIAAPDGGSAEVHGLTVGQSVEVSDPRNAFMMPLPGSGSRAERLRFIAGGIGITPILPMTKIAEQRSVPWSLRYTGRHRGSLPFLDELQAYGDKVHVRTDDECGLPTAADLLDGVDDKTAVYMCGPPPMMALVRRSIPVGFEVHSERFSPPPVVDGAPFELKLARTGEVVPVRADQSALAALQEARPDASYSCRQGFCGTCVQQVTAGEVEHRDSTLTGRQRELGQMLVCVSRAKHDGGQLVLDI